MPDYPVIRTWQELVDHCRSMEPGEHKTLDIRLNPNQGMFTGPKSAEARLNKNLSDKGVFSASWSQPYLNVYLSR